MIVTTRAPLRIDFAGGWSDVPIFSDQYGGEVLNAAVTRYATVTARRLDRGIRLGAKDIDATLELASIDSIRYDGRLDLHKAALRTLPVENVELISDTQAPSGSGLGASGALDVALIGALASLRPDGTPSAPDLAELAFSLEAVELGLAGGRQDQYAAALGGFQRLTFDDAGVTSRPLDLTNERIRELESCVTIGYTGQTHFSAATHNSVWDRFRSETHDVVDAILTMKKIVGPASDALCSGNWRELARLVDANWEQQQRLHDSIATPLMRATEAAARRGGAWGTKAAGAGAGGCMILIGPPDCRSAIGSAVERCGGTVLQFEFDSRGIRTVS